MKRLAALFILSVASLFAQNIGIGTGSLQATTGNVQSAPFYASGSSATTTSSGTTSAGATSITVASSATFLPNQGMLIGVSGANASTTTAFVTITGVVGNVISFTPALIAGSSYASSTNVQHDDSAAFQAASSAMSPAGGVFFVPTGYYRLNNCNATNSAVVSLPAIAQVNTYVSTPVITVGFSGTYQQSFLAGSSQLQPILQTDCTSG